jgi:hypothetical protein
VKDFEDELENHEMDDTRLREAKKDLDESDHKHIQGFAGMLSEISEHLT